jgi:hypothetical protein
MAKCSVKALDSFSHGRLNAVGGETYTMSRGAAEDLAKVGLVEIEGDAKDDDTDDLVGRKVAPVTSNKMEGKTSNKTEKK